MGLWGGRNEFLVNPTNGHITHLILREGHLWGQKDVTIPVSQIQRIEEDAVYLKLDKRHVAALPAIPVGAGGGSDRAYIKAFLVHRRFTHRGLWL